MNGFVKVCPNTAPDSEPVSEGVKEMNAIIETGGKQYKVAEGDVLFIEKLDVEAGDKVTFDKVLAILDGENAILIRPLFFFVG